VTAISSAASCANAAGIAPDTIAASMATAANTIFIFVSCWVTKAPPVCSWWLTNCCR
jgi:hypothetical protein